MAITITSVVNKPVSLFANATSIATLPIRIGIANRFAVDINITMIAPGNNDFSYGFKYANNRNIWRQLKRFSIASSTEYEKRSKWRLLCVFFVCLSPITLPLPLHFA